MNINWTVIRYELKVLGINGKNFIMTDLFFVFQWAQTNNVPYKIKVTTIFNGVSMMKSYFESRMIYLFGQGFKWSSVISFLR